jgi:hypothetical protein
MATAVDMQMQALLNAMQMLKTQVQTMAEMHVAKMANGGGKKWDNLE